KASTTPDIYYIGAEWQFAPNLMPKWYFQFSSGSHYIRSVYDNTFTNRIDIYKLAYFVFNDISIEKQLGNGNRRFFFDNAHIGLFATTRSRPRFEPFSHLLTINRIYIGPRIGFNQRIFKGLYADFSYQQPLVIDRSPTKSQTVFALQINRISMTISYRFTAL
ncbi:MAG: hypothetical protein KDC92_08040, partial [Bacteroidetes bacterium]|nr:hypothetical protein [Bacteroidota bacterium]